ncbi:MAG: hypothetical protein M3Q44_05435 [bacterium]|nr:hypothetical protein [bacterium]
MDAFESLVRSMAVKSAADIEPVEIDKLLSQIEFSPLSSGAFFRVFKIHNQPWVVKEGRWDVELELHDKIKLPMHSGMREPFFKKFYSELFPSLEEIKRQYEMYLRFTEYFGFLSPTGDRFYADHDEMCRKQKTIRDSLVSQIPLIESEYKIKLQKKLGPILNSDLKYFNLLPKEYMLVGKSISPENKGNITVYIFQEYVEGLRLHDVKRKNMTYEQKGQLILLVYLILLMNQEIQLLPDTRPRYPVLELFHWLPKTDNIVVGEKGVVFVDTRWFFETQRNFLKRGTLIPELSIRAAKSYLHGLLLSI